MLPVIFFKKDYEYSTIQSGEVVGFCSDIHGNLPALLEIIGKHPKVKTWYCLGDLVDSLGDRFKQNKQTIEWYNEHSAKFKLILGNHDLYYHNGLQHRCFKQLPSAFNITTPKGIMCAYHSRPDIPQGNIDQYTPIESIRPIFEPTNASIILIGHNHAQFEVDCGTFKLFSIGAVCIDKHYAIYDNGMHLL